MKKIDVLEMRSVSAGDVVEYTGGSLIFNIGYFRVTFERTKLGFMTFEKIESRNALPKDDDDYDYYTAGTAFLYFNPMKFCVSAINWLFNN